MDVIGWLRVMLPLDPAKGKPEAKDADYGLEEPR
jgi:hypothetical protein